MLARRTLWETSMRHRLITFDITNTILKFTRNVGEHYAEVASLHGVHLHADDLQHNFRRQWHRQNRAKPNFGAGAGLSSYDWWRDLVCHTFVDSGYRGPASKLRTIAHVLFSLYSQASCMEVVADAPRHLTRLRAGGAKLGVISNWDERLVDIMRAHDLLQAFDFVLPSVSVGFCKPQPEIFDIALTLGGRGIQPFQAAHVGDNVKLDYHAARRAGWHAYLINQRLSSVPQDLFDVDTQTLFTDIHELTDYIVSDQGLREELRIE